MSDNLFRETSTEQRLLSVHCAIIYSKLKNKTQIITI